MRTENKTCRDCAHFTHNNKCADTLLLISRDPSQKACKFFKEVDA